MLDARLDAGSLKVLRSYRAPSATGRIRCGEQGHDYKNLCPRTACLSPAAPVNSAYGRTGNAPVAEPCAATGAGAAAPAEPSHPSSAPPRAAQSGSTGNGNKPGAGGPAERAEPGRTQPRRALADDNFKEEFDKLARLDEEWRDYM